MGSDRPGAGADVKALALAAVLCLGSAGAAAAQERLIEARTLFSSSDDVDRGRSSVVFDTLWTFGGPSDTLLAFPEVLRPDGAGGVVVLDLGYQTVFRLGANGDLLWSWGTRGEGPGELKSVQTMDVAPDGSVVLVDSGNRRVVRLSADGQLLGEARVPGRGWLSARSAAALRDGRLAVAGSPGARSLLAMWGPDDGDIAPVRLPGGFGFGEFRHYLQHRGSVVRWGDSGWVFGFLVGNGWMAFRGGELLGTYPYIEHVDFPKLREVRNGNSVSRRPVRRPAETGRSLSVVGDTLFVLFGGENESRFRGWVLDKFDVRSGTYLGTDVLPHYANRAVVDGDRAFTIHFGGGSALFPRIVALARRSAPQP